MVSERVYGPVVRGKVEFTAEDMETYWGKFMALKPIIIYCRPPLEVSLQTLNERPQMEGVIQKYKEIQKAYDNVFKFLYGGGVKFMVYNFVEDPMAADLIHDIKNQIRRSK